MARAIEVELIHESLREPRERRKSGPDQRPERPKNKHRTVPAGVKKPVELVGTRKWKNWETVNICGQRYRIRVDTAYDPKKIEGSCEWSNNLIELMVQAEDRMHDTLIHEIVHAITDASGLKWAIANRFRKLTKKDRADLDEMLCRLLSPALLGALRDAGWLKLPRKPRT